MVKEEEYIQSARIIHVFVRGEGGRLSCRPYRRNLRRAIIIRGGGGDFNAAKLRSITAV